MLETEVDYSDGVASITVDELGAYAFSQIPEPSTYAAMFGAFALALTVYRKRK